MPNNTPHKSTKSNLPPSWVETTLGEVVEIKNKKLKINNLTLDNYISTENLLPDRLGVQKSANLPNITNVNGFKKEDTLFSNIRTYFKKVWYARFDGGASNDVLIFTPKDESKLDKKFLYYFISSDRFINFTVVSAKGTKMPRGDKEAMKALSFSLPPLPEQKAIASVLSAFDDKIELLREQNKILEELGQTIFKEWFGNYGVDDELPDGWRVGKVKDIVDIFDSQRIPLSSNQRLEKQGKYPYHGATSIMDYVDEYLFDGIYLLLAEDGSVMDQNGYPVLQYVWDKFWVNNHAHVLQGANDFSTEMLYLLFKKTKIAGIVNGAVQLKINQTNLMNLEIIIPDQETLKQFNKAIQPIFTKIRYNSEQSQSLARSRDELLPNLMRGEVRVRF